MWSWSPPHSPLKSGQDDQKLIEKKPSTKDPSCLGVWKLICGLKGIFFLLAAYVQHNDPDPLLWIIGLRSQSFILALISPKFPAYLLPTLISWTTCLKIHLYLKQQAKNCKMSVNLETNLPKWVILERLIGISKLYSLFLGLYTLGHYIYIHHYQGEEWTEFLKSWTSEIPEGDMMIEEGKELLGLCLIIAWLSLIEDQKFIRFGRMGLGIGVALTLVPLITWLLLHLIEGTYATNNNTTTCH